MKEKSRKGESRQGCGQFESSALLAAIDGKRYIAVFLDPSLLIVGERERERKRSALALRSSKNDTKECGGHGGEGLGKKKMGRPRCAA